MNKLDSKKLMIFIVAIIVLFVIPIYTIVKSSDTLKDGTEYLFKIETYDPYDMFRGTYLNIRFEEDSIDYNGTIDDMDEDDYYKAKECYLTIKTREDGFSYFDRVYFTKPTNIRDYYKTTGRVYRGSSEIRIDTPTRYYMNEDKVERAEEVYRENIDDAYVKVRVKDGKMVIVGVYINGILIDSIN